MKLALFSLLLLTSPFLAEARMPSCQETYTIALSATRGHLNQPKIDENFLQKSFYVYLDLKDGNKLYLTQQEVEELAKDFNYKRERIFSQIKQNDCSYYVGLDKKIAKGKERWKKMLADSLKNPLDKSAELERDKKIEPFATEVELKAHADSVVAKFFRIERAVKKLKTDKDIANKFSQLYLSTKKSTISDMDALTDNLTRSFFLAMDPHSDYISDDDSEDFRVNMTANLQGVGLVLNDDPLGVKISKVIKGGPAEKSEKFKKDDIITQIDKKPIANLQLGDVTRLLRGAKGTKVTLTRSREDKESKQVLTEDVELVRDIIAMEDQKVQGQEYTIEGKRILSIYVPSFYYDPDTRSGVTYDTIKLYNKFKEKGKIDGIVLDLRGNPGGLLDEGIHLVGLFIKDPDQKAAVQVKSGKQITRLKSAKTPITINEPLVVMINRGSASAAEIVAGGLKDYGRAVVVGDDRTYGKGTVQSIINSFKELQLGTFKITTAMFFTPSGSSTQIKGVSSDIVIPSSSALQEYGENQQRYALEWASVPSAVEKLEANEVASLVGRLKEKSNARIKQDKEYLRYNTAETYEKWLESEAANENEEDEYKFNPKKDLGLREGLNIAVDLANLKK